MPRKATKGSIQNKIAEHIEDGCTQAASYGAENVPKRTFYNWLKDDAIFKEKVELAKAKARQKVEKKLVDSILDGDRLLLMFWLQNRYPDAWKDTRSIKIDQHTVMEDKRIASLSDDEVIKELEKDGFDCSAFKAEVAATENE